MQTLNDFFNTQQGNPAWAKAVTGQEDFLAAKEIMDQELDRDELPPDFYARLLLKLCKALDLKIGVLLASGWCKRQEIVSYRDKENPAEGYHTVILLEHTLVSKHKPAIQPVINQVPLASFEFDVFLKLKLGGGKLYIRDGTIHKAGTGTWTGNGSVEYKGIPILKKKTTTYNLPGELVFNPPIRI